MVTAIGSIVPIPATLRIGFGVVAMDKQDFQHEIAFQVTMHLLRNMRDKKFISEKEYHAAEREILSKYNPPLGSLFT